MQLPTLEQVRAEQARRSLAAFVRQAWHVFEPGTPLKWSWVLDAICEHVQALLEDRLIRDGRVIRNLVINVPPGTSKSTITSVCLPAWMWIRNPAWRGLFASGNENVAVRDSIKCRSLLDSDWYRGLFHPQWTFSKDQNAKTLYQNSATGFRQAISAGAIVVGQRADDLFVDDPNGTNEGAADRANVTTWWDNAMWNRLNNLSTGHRVIIQQRVHEDDLTGHVQGKDPDDWAFLVIRMEYEAPGEKDPDRVPTPLGWTDPRTEEGTLMFPERFPADVVAAQKKVLGIAGTAGQLQQRPAPKDGLIFRAGFVQFYDPALPLPKFKRKIMSWDTAFKEKQQNDPSCGLVGGEADAGIYLLDHVLDKMSYPALKEKAKTWAAVHNPTALLIEDKASGQSLIQELKQGTSLPVVPVQVDTDKVTRAWAIVPTWEAGRIFLPSGAPWVDGFLAELYTFPRGHDDQVDALTQLVRYLIQGGGSTGMLEWMRQEVEALNAAKQREEVA